ncbi:MAG: helix-turn-helix transcriptional regulator [Deltaproteobacteria bacterium]|nr:helix-turn-helix transcriptional regulator [Deltaproteobacteria bacterium]
MGAGDGRFTIGFYVDPWGRSVFEDWVQTLTDEQSEALLAALEASLGRLGIAVCGSEFGKPLGHGLFGFRHLAAECIRLRQEAGLSQRALARASGVPQSEISRMERGLANPTWRTLEAVARASGMTLAFVPLPKRERPRRGSRAR